MNVTQQVYMLYSNRCSIRPGQIKQRTVATRLVLVWPTNNHMCVHEITIIRHGVK